MLIEYEPALRELGNLVLSEALYQVEIAPPTEDPIPIAEKLNPDVIVLGLRPNEPAVWEIVDRLRLNPRTQMIPVVVITTAETVAAEASASPNVRATVSAPYDIDTLRNAVATAIGNPPPDALLPVAVHPPSETLTVVYQELQRHARTIVLRTIARLQQVEPYTSRFPRLAPALIDDLPVIFSAITNGLYRDLPPVAVYTVDGVEQAIDSHTRLRASQGLGPMTVVREYHTLRDEMVVFLRGLIGRDNVTALDIFDMHAQLDHFFAQLVEIVVDRHCTPRLPTSGSTPGDPASPP